MRKTLKRVERKILVYNKMKNKGLSYEQACNELEQELKYLNEQQKQKQQVLPQTDFKEELQDG